MPAVRPGVHGVPQLSRQNRTLRSRHGDTHRRILDQFARLFLPNAVAECTRLRTERAMRRLVERLGTRRAYMGLFTYYAAKVVGSRTVGSPTMISEQARLGTSIQDPTQHLADPVYPDADGIQRNEQRTSSGG